MDCAKFESTLIDELYGELDDVTSAAARQHAAGCATCGPLLGGLKATRQLAVLPMVSPSADLEDRILAAARSAEKVVPIQGRPSRAFSWATSVAMRPQVAMAALFLVMVGSGALFLRGQSKDEASSAAAPVAVAIQPSPAASAPPAVAVLAPPATAAAAPGSIGGAAAQPPTEAARVNKDDGTLAQNDPGDNAGYGTSTGHGRAGGGGLNADTPAAGAPAAHYKSDSARARSAEAARDLSSSTPPPPAALAAPAASAAAAPAFEGAMALYRAGQYGDAARAFDGLAANDARAALMAARSVRDGNGGCAAAVPRFDAVLSRPGVPGTVTGYDATLEGGRCLQAQGSTDAARTRFQSLLSVPAYTSRAQAELDALSRAQGQVAARRDEKAPAAQPTVAPQASPPAQRQAPAKPKASFNQNSL